MVEPHLAPVKTQKRLIGYNKGGCAAHRVRGHATPRRQSHAALVLRSSARRHTAVWIWNNFKLPPERVETTRIHPSFTACTLFGLSWAPSHAIALGSARQSAPFEASPPPSPLYVMPPAVPFMLLAHFRASCVCLRLHPTPDACPSPAGPCRGRALRGQSCSVSIDGLPRIVMYCLCPGGHDCMIRHQLVFAEQS